ncbi:MAG TPA: amino acid permease [Saprospiraceae bacterium]|nr:amino acid permease [Saprospiraceae bacterium]
MQGINAPSVQEDPSSKESLRKQIGFFGLTMIAAGSCIGSGIFITPSDVADQLGNTTAVLLVWLWGGVVAITGSLTFAELAARFPDAGGVYIYIRECFGRLLAFLYGWCILTVITSGAIAALSLTFARYLSVLIPLSNIGQIIVGISAIAAVTLINVLGVKPGEVFSSVFTLFKLVGLSGIIVAGILIGRAIPETPVNIGTIDTFPGIGAFALAMIGVLWSYGGWHHASYVAAETKGATRIVPRAMILGTLIVTATYMLANYAYLRLLPLETLASSQAVASDALKSVLPIGAMLVTLLIAISTFGSIGIYTLTAPRIYYSMARDGSFFRAIAKLHPRHQTPIWAISIQSGWAVVLLLFWTTFENLMTYVVFMDWVFMTLAALSIFYFRKKFAALPATGFRTPLYPIIPLVFIGISVWFVAYTLIGKPAQAWGGIVLLLAGLPVYYFSRKKEI